MNVEDCQKEHNKAIKEKGVNSVEALSTACCFYTEAVMWID